MVIEFLGIFVFAYMMGNINNLISQVTESTTQIIDTQKEELDIWLMRIDRANPKKKLRIEDVKDIT